MIWMTEHIYVRMICCYEGISHIPQGPFLQTKNPRHRVEFLQKLLDSFWKRWTRDVFPCLVPRKKWNVGRRNVKVNDVVMMVDSSVARGNWTIGRITEVHPGKDGKIHNVTVKTQNGTYRRPISKIAVIHPVDGNWNEDNVLIGVEDVLFIYGLCNITLVSITYAVLHVTYNFSGNGNTLFHRTVLRVFKFCL